VAIAFDHAVMKNGEQMQMPMSIQAIIAAPNRNPQTPVLSNLQAPPVREQAMRPHPAPDVQDPRVEPLLRLRVPHKHLAARRPELRRAIKRSNRSLEIHRV